MIDCVPAARVVVVNVATPLAFKVPVPKVAVPSRNVTVPVGTLLPDFGVMVAVKVTLCPLLMEVAEELSTVVVAITADVMVTVMGCEVEPASLESPPYDAVIESDPTGRVVVPKAARPLGFRVAVPKEALPL